MTVFEMNNKIEEALHPKFDRYAIYLRKSREDVKAEERGEGETLARHRKILTDFAARRGFYIEKIYEEVVSGETIKDRPQIQQLITDCYAGKYRGVLVVEISRLSRGNQGDAQTILDCLKYSNSNNGLLVITPTKTYDVAHNPDDEEYMEFELFMSRREYKMITKRMQRGREQSVIEGNYIAASRPYGYDIVETKTARTLKENPAEGPIVRKIFEWKVNHNLSPGKIAAKLTTQGVPTYSGAPEWHKETIKKIIANPIYIGKVCHNSRMTVKQMVDGQLVNKLQNMRNTEHYMEYDGKHEGLVSEEIFNAAKKTSRKDNTKEGYELRNVLAGLLVCQKCQKVLHYFGHKTKSSLNPRLHHQISQKCKVKSASYPDVMDAFVYGLKQYLEDFKMKLDNKSGIDKDEIQTQIKTLVKERRKIEKILDNMFDDYENEVYTANEFVKRKAKHNARLEGIEKEIAELEATIPQKEEYEEKIVFLHEALEMLKDDTIPARIKNEYLKEFVERVEFSRENDLEFTLDIYLV